MPNIRPLSTFQAPLKTRVAGRLIHPALDNATIMGTNVPILFGQTCNLT